MDPVFAITVSTDGLADTSTFVRHIMHVARKAHFHQTVGTPWLDPSKLDPQVPFQYLERDRTVCLGTRSLQRYSYLDQDKYRAPDHCAPETSMPYDRYGMLVRRRGAPYSFMKVELPTSSW